MRLLTAFRMAPETLRCARLAEHREGRCGKVFGMDLSACEHLPNGQEQVRSCAEIDSTSPELLVASRRVFCVRRARSPRARWHPDARACEGDRHPRFEQARRQTGRTFKLEVKTTRTGLRGGKIFGPCYGWVMDERHGHVHDKDLIYCFVRLPEQNDGPGFFLVPSKDVAAYVHWEHQHFLRRSKRKEHKPSTLRMFRIPTDAAACAMPRSWRDGRWQGWKANWKIFGART